MSIQNTIDSIPSVKAEKETALGRLVAGTQDTLNGQKINTTSMAFGIHGGTATTTHNGIEKEINITSMGHTLSLDHAGRTFFLDIKKVIAHAVENGLLDETVDFKSAE